MVDADGQYATDDVLRTCAVTPRKRRSETQRLERDGPSTGSSPKRALLAYAAIATRGQRPAMKVGCGPLARVGGEASCKQARRGADPNYAHRSTVCVVWAVWSLFILAFPKNCAHRNTVCVVARQGSVVYVPFGHLEFEQELCRPRILMPAPSRSASRRSLP